MRPLALSLLLLVFAAPLALGQPTEQEPAALYARGNTPPPRITFEGVFQRFEDEGEDITEISVPLSVYLPIGPNIALGLSTNYATVSGSQIETLSGVGDVQIVTSYFQPAGDGSLVVSLAFSASTGDTALSFEEFRTATLAGQTVYDLRVPTFGQGIRVSPSVTYAFPVGDRTALGLGASYQYRGPYEPLDDQPDQYDPGEEILLTAGADLEITPTSSVSLDLSLGLNGTDSWGTVEYEPGNTTAATLQFLKLLGLHEVRLVARYSERGEGDLPLSVSAAEVAVPTRLVVMGDARFQVAPTFRVGVLARARRYGESALFAEGQTLTDLGLMPMVEVSETLSLSGRFVYTLGSFSGFTAGGGVSIAL